MQRTREEIEADIAKVQGDPLTVTERIALELWLDIRELLQHPPIVNVDSEPHKVL